jgi:PAS domain S-box-containing protein
MVCIAREFSLNPRSGAILFSWDFHVAGINPNRATLLAGMEGEFWDVFETSRNAMLLADDRRHLVAANRPALDMLGVSAQELTQLRMDDMVPADWHEDLAMRWALFLERGSLHGHYPLALPSGRRTEIEYSATAHVLPGRHLTIMLELDDFAHPRDSLTDREREVVREIAQGSTTHEIAAKLFISPTTVDTHVRKAMLRLGAKNRAHLIALALQQREI